MTRVISMPRLPSPVKSVTAIGIGRELATAHVNNQFRLGRAHCRNHSEQQDERQVTSGISTRLMRGMRHRRTFQLKRTQGDDAGRICAWHSVSGRPGSGTLHVPGHRRARMVRGRKVLTVTVRSPHPFARIEIDDEDAPIIVMRREFGGNAEWCAASCRPLTQHPPRPGTACLTGRSRPRAPRRASHPGSG